MRATSGAERALILSPRESPQITDVDLQLRPTGLDPGVYHYRISAEFSASDSDNPGGESLASDELTIRVPSFPGKNVVLTLIWRAPVDSLGAPLAGVTGYRIYRGSKQVSTTSGISYTDKNLQPATSYSYTVAAYDAAGNVSARSNTATGTSGRTRKSLPRTSSSLALFELLSGLSLAGGFAARQLRQRLS